MKVIGIIPSRFGSTRFPGKPLIDIHGKSMIQRVYEQCLKSELDEVWVATDDNRIKEEVISFNGQVVMTSPDISNGSERCRVAFRMIQSDADAFINIQGDEPCISPQSINALIQTLKQEEVRIATLIRKEEDEDEIVDPNRVKVVIDKNGKALFFSRSVIPFPRKKPSDLIRYIHVGIYGFKSDCIDELDGMMQSAEEKAEQLEQLTWLVNGIDIYTALSEDNGPAIDSPADYEYALANWKQFAID
ncbi:MAG: 3-deoxy-manno-octulosonate cytidylyltransferase [Bacteroidota bacterium]